MRDAVDAIVELPIDQLVAVELDALVYTGNARPSAAWCDAARAAGITVTFIQETYSSRSTEGYAVGVADCQFAEARARERAHGGSVAVVVSDGNYADRWNAAEYGRGWSDTATLPYFAYGAHGVIDTFYNGALAGAGANLIVAGNDGLPGRWVPETWGATNLIGQVVGPSPVGDTDLNHVHAEYTGGAAASAPTTRKARSVIYREDKADGTHDYCIVGAADMVSVPESVGVGHAINGDIVVPIKTVERIAMGVALKRSATAALAEPGTPTAALDPAKIKAANDALDALTAALAAIAAA